ncbi:preprotein translocase subunit YajC [Listeria monocytogenes]|nr:preprotein translocase subunit YajC [Listeria monocytogenes]EAD6049997.1 preprotein translocase subunit YajC [Listeria monocytogenes]EAD6071578.1 preprotein translocase subunit YajC [Listeria monocytogenes]EAD6078889.1 preprotein translocase subunit YajC [Listeria monocytogenes]EAD6263557.1 preprotein translocase subunit YajC [Listeria monocytogenes]
MIFFTFIGLVAVVSIIPILLSATLVSFKNKRALKWVRLGDEIKQVGEIFPHRGIVISIDKQKRKLIILKSEYSEGYFLKKVQPGDYEPTGKTYSKEELKELIPEISKRLHKEADEDVAIYEKKLTK